MTNINSSAVSIQLGTLVTQKHYLNVILHSLGRFVQMHLRCRDHLMIYVFYHSDMYLTLTIHNQINE